MEKKLEDLFNENKEYIIYIPIPNTKYFLYIEGLNEFGEVINDKHFNINNIKTFCIELFEEQSDGIMEFYETIDPFGINLNENIEDLIEKTINYIEEE